MTSPEVFKIYGTSRRNIHILLLTCNPEKRKEIIHINEQLIDLGTDE